MVDNFRHSDGSDPVASPELNDDLEASIHQYNLRTGDLQGESEPDLREDLPPRRHRLEAAIGGLMVLAIVVGLVVAGYFVVKWLSGGSDSGESATPPIEITDLAALAAIPGETFEGSYDQLRVGEDIASGVYIAADAAPWSSPEGLGCAWSVNQDGEWDPDGLNILGNVEEGTAMLLAPVGYIVKTSPYCGTWEAVDPATVFDGGSGTTIGSEYHVVGHDVRPGMYLSAEPVASGASCVVSVEGNFGFRGDSSHAEFYPGQGGTIMFTVEAGEFVRARNCPNFEWADPATAFTNSTAATSLDAGTWLVGVDVAPGTYEGPDVDSDSSAYCSASVWEGRHVRPKEDPPPTVSYGREREAANLVLEPGQSVQISGCDGWELVQP